MAQIGTQFPRPIPRAPASGPDTPADSFDITRVGRAAERIFSDSLHTLPEQLDAWWTEAYAAAVNLLPRLLVALAAMGVIIAATMLVRAALRRRHAAGGDAAAPHHETTVGVVGVLLAATVGAALAGANAIAAACLVFLVFYIPASLLKLFGTRALQRSRAAPEAIELVLTIARYALIALGTVEAFGALGLRVGGVLAGLGIIGIALGFAAQDVLANLIAGFTILWDQPLRVGDWVRIGDHEGRVRQITLRSTRIETRDDGILVLPNREVTSGRVYNYSLRHLTRVRVPVDIAYESDVARARELIRGSLMPDDVVSARPEPVVATTSFGERGVRLELVFYITDPREALPIRWSLNAHILSALRDGGIALAYPHMHLHFDRDAGSPLGQRAPVES